MSHAIVLDTNILVSAGLKPLSPVAAIVERALMRTVPVHVCPSLVLEYQAVMARPTQATAIQIGNPVSYPRAVRTLQRFAGVVEEATEDELAQAAAQADLAGLFTDPHTGVALAVLEKLIANHTIGPRERVVVISTANGLKFTDFKVGYHEGTLAGVKPTLANLPFNLPADYDAVRRAIFD